MRYGIDYCLPIFGVFDLLPWVETTTTTTHTERNDDDGIQIVYITIIVALSLVVVALIASILIKVIKDWRIKATTETEEDNENYGNLDPGEYYEEE